MTNSIELNEFSDLVITNILTGTIQATDTDIVTCTIQTTETQRMVPFNQMIVPLHLV